MPRHVALLRAINVGGHTVRMDRLRALFEALGLSRVETFIASGNVVFDAGAADPAALERAVEAHLRDALGYEVATFVRSLPELDAVAGHEPFGPAPDGHTLSVAFLKDAPPAGAARALLDLRGEVDDFHLHGRELYWLCRTRTSDSAFSGAVLERTLRMPATIRNLTTVRRLAAKYRDA